MPEQLSQDDWADQDLLTNDEAEQRLVDALRELEGELAAGPDPVRERRLRAIRQRLAQLRGGSAR